MPLWMNFCDCLCLSSWSEGMPNVILEALASGLPVVATDVGACRDLLDDEPMARLVPPGDAPKMAEAIGDLLSRTVDRPALAARNGKRSWADQAQEVLALIGKERCSVVR
jgi:glycosyltransferase involved in cell wall biosynthesis